MGSLLIAIQCAPTPDQVAAPQGSLSTFAIRTGLSGILVTRRGSGVVVETLARRGPVRVLTMNRRQPFRGKTSGWRGDPVFDVSRILGGPIATRQGPRRYAIHAW